MAPAEILADPKFKALSQSEQLKVMQAVDPQFAGLHPDQQMRVLTQSRGAATQPLGAFSEHGPVANFVSGVTGGLSDVDWPKEAFGEGQTRPGVGANPLVLDPHAKGGFIGDAVEGLGKSLSRTTQAWHDMFTGKFNWQTPAEMLPLIGPGAVDTSNAVFGDDTARGLGQATSMMLPGLMEMGRTGVASAASRFAPDASQVPQTLADAMKPGKYHLNFKETIPETAANIKYGAEAIGRPITDVDSAIAGAEAYMGANRMALEPFKQAMRASNHQFDSQVVTQHMIDSIPPWLKDRNPAEYKAVVAEIKSLYPNRLMSVDQAFNALEGANARTAGFRNAQPAVMNSKLVANTADATLLNAETQGWRKLLYSAPGGQDAAELQRLYGEAKQTRGYLQGQVNPVLANQTPKTDAGAAVQATAGISKPNVVGVVSTAKNLAEPSGTNELLRKGFEAVNAANDPGWLRWSPFGTKFGQRMLEPAPPGLTPHNVAIPGRGKPVTPSSGQVIPVSGDITPEAVQQYFKDVIEQGNASRWPSRETTGDPAGRRLLPPAGGPLSRTNPNPSENYTFLQGSGARGSQIPYELHPSELEHTLPSTPDTSFVRQVEGGTEGTGFQQEAVTRRELAHKLFNGASYDQLGPRQKTVVENVIRNGNRLKLEDLVRMQQP